MICRSPLNVAGHKFELITIGKIRYRGATCFLLTSKFVFETKNNVSNCFDFFFFFFLKKKKEDHT